MFFVANELERVKNDFHDLKHNAHVDAAVKSSELELLKKKLSYEMHLRKVGFPNTLLPDLQFKLQTYKREIEALENEVERVKEKSHKTGIECKKIN